MKNCWPRSSTPRSTRSVGVTVTADASCAASNSAANSGFPTANLRWPQNSLGFGGIFAVRVDGAGLHQHPGVASLGYRPVVRGKELLLEVHLFDFDGDLYGKRLTIDFIAKQRDEWHFPDLASLVEQIRRDADEALRLLGVRPA
ncbi:MAG: riboflavin kinase [Rhodanobacteraceae bacterium]|nr:riboflavin kinase [Rhodanobacteraceae bacterium]